MDCQELVVDEAADGEDVEGVHEQVVGLLVVLSQHLDPEVEERRHLPSLVVAAQQEHGFGVVQLERVDQQHHFNGEGASVHVVSQEQVFCVFGVAAHVQHFDEVVILAMDVSYNSNRVFQL